MQIQIAAFTDNGLALAHRVFDDWKTHEIRIERIGPQVRLHEWTSKAFARRDALVFVGAMGIAVRAIAPFVKDKLTDSAVIVMDELGQHVIPVLSGHVGGANELALAIAEAAQAVPVLTTATDVHGRWAVDVFARNNHLAIRNREGIAKISAKILSGEKVTMMVEDSLWKRYGHGWSLPDQVERIAYDPQEWADIRIAGHVGEVTGQTLLLQPQRYVIGMGCRKGKSMEELWGFVTEVLNGHAQTMLGRPVDPADICAIASIDEKKHEPGLVELARRLGVEFCTFSAGKLKQIPGEFTPSAFVEGKMGVDNVCERAALAAAGEQGLLLMRKYAKNGMTAAIAVRSGR